MVVIRKSTAVLVVLTNLATPCLPARAEGFVAVVRAVPIEPRAASPLGALGGFERISVARDGGRANGSFSFAPSMSTDGRFVVFESDASNLVDGDTNDTYDIFVRDRLTGRTTLESVNSARAQANGGSGLPSISANGRYIAFSSSSTNLVVGVSGSQIYWRDRIAGITELASVSTSGMAASDGTGGPTISRDGRYVAFYSVASNLVPSDTNNCRDVFVRDVVAGTTTRESVTSAGGQGSCASFEDGSFDAALSGDGRFVAFASTSSLVPSVPPAGCAFCGNVYVRDRVTGVTSVESNTLDGRMLGGVHPSLSADGRYMVFTADPRSFDRGTYLRDRVTGETTVLAAGASNDVSISADGRYTTYDQQCCRITVYDRVTQTSVNAPGSTAGAVESRLTVFTKDDDISPTKVVKEVYLAALPAAPSTPVDLRSSVIGSTVTLTWTVGGGALAADGYTIEAGSAPGNRDLANYSTGTRQTTFRTTVGVSGIFYVRVRATSGEEASDASNEIVVVVGSGMLPPGAPQSLTASVTGATVTLTWTPPTGSSAPTTYVIEAGTRSGSSELANFATGSTSTTFTAGGISPGTYFVRVRAVNGAGASPPSNETVLIVAGR